MLQQRHTCGEEDTEKARAAAVLQLCCLGFALLVSASASAGKLDAVRDATDAGDSGESGSSDNGSSDNGDDDSDGDGVCTSVDVCEGSDDTVNNDGDTVRLLGPDAAEVDTFAYAKTRSDGSYSRSSDGDGPWTDTYPPSPGQANLAPTPTPTPRYWGPSWGPSTDPGSSPKR